MIGAIEPRHHENILKLNAEFVHWLSPLDQAGLSFLLEVATYARQIEEGAGVLIGYAYDAAYPDHKNLRWLQARLDNFFYVDRIIIAAAAQGKGYGQQLYADLEAYARRCGYDWVACEVNSLPNNPGSHAFHLKRGFQTLGDEAYPKIGKALRYYAKALN